ncbi:unnamed protein product [Lactuca saligna]|uniref:Uncharacterized protein n=1 Tax=Lactuca saligna TaxID=75948 RepID=A0AA35VKT7_LACSI|nr:unnamed protein product [Lactuca saligna]
MMDEAACKPSEIPQNLICPMISLETAITPISPPPQTTSTTSEAPPSGSPPPSLAIVAPSITTHIPITTLNSVTPPLLTTADPILLSHLVYRCFFPTLAD